ncbi:MAG: SDR family oxidoreductase [Chloroflexia bacterium]
MDMGLRGTVALVAASSQGLGKAVAFGLAHEGASVVLCARNLENLEAVAAEIREATGSQAMAVRTDLTQEEDIKRVVALSVEQFGRLDVLVNNAGGPPPGDFTKHDDAAWYRAFDLNLMSAARLIREALPYLKSSGRGRIINLTSVAVKQPVDGLILSNAIRAAVTGMAKTLSTELAPFGITVNSIAPGRINTERIRQLDRARASASGTTEQEVEDYFISQIPIGRYGEPEELANLAVFLASDKASYITGTTIQVDGGLFKGLV